MATAGRSHPYNSFTRVTHFVGYFFPFFLWLGQYFLVPATRYSVFDTFGLTSSELAWLFGAQAAAAVLVFLWVLMDARSLGHHDTPLNYLKENSFLSGVIMGAIWVVAAYMFAFGTLPWCLVIPLMASPIDFYFSNDAGYENAWSKNPTQIQPR